MQELKQLSDDPSIYRMLRFRITTLRSSPINDIFTQLRQVQEIQPWNASVYFCSRPLHACHDSSLSYKSLDIGPPSTLSLRHFNSTRDRQCEVELIPKSGVYTLSVFIQRSRIRSFGYQLYHTKASAIKVFLLHLALGPLALMRIAVRPGGKAPHLIGRSQFTTKRLSLGSLSVSHPHPKNVVSHQMRAESKHSNKLALGYRVSRDLLAGSLSSVPTGVLHQQ